MDSDKGFLVKVSGLGESVLDGMTAVQFPNFHRHTRVYPVVVFVIVGDNNGGAYPVVFHGIPEKLHGVAAEKVRAGFFDIVL